MRGTTAARRSRSTRSAASSSCSSRRGAERPLARRCADALLAGRRRHGRPAERTPSSSDVRAGQQLPLVGGSAHPFRARLRDAGRAADRPLPFRGVHPACERAGRPRRHRPRAAGDTAATPAATRARLSSCSPRCTAVGRSRACGTTRRSPCSLRAAPSEPVQARDLYDLALAVRQAYTQARAGRP